MFAAAEGGELFTQSKNRISVKLLLGDPERRHCVRVGNVFSHKHIQLFDHGKLALQGVIQDQNYELRPAKNVCINEPDQLDHFVIIDIAQVSMLHLTVLRRPGKRAATTLLRKGRHDADDQPARH